MSPFLYIGRIIDSDHSEGNVPVLNNLLRHSVKKNVKHKGLNIYIF